MSPVPALTGSAASLREEFDRSFSLAPASPAAGSVNLLTIRIGTEPYAIRLADIRGLHADRSILELPSPLPELLGVTNFRGQIVPVYQLAALLGKAAGAAPRWMVLAKASAPLALAFEAFDSHICADAGQLIASADAAGQGRPREGVRTGAGVVPVLDIGALAAQIEARTAHAPQGQQP
ncbi:chemotaxis protein CheW [Chromobacterium piscinae]|uniref:chemotaxis protein CheW n=1 Tax=Chromobacterium piscinae TaxID=686831 RepID=UPI00140B098D|nr:chemotaxis protein CheW [Chromobacterium piscinae]MBX9348608.1 chemotaxis protein CheW [Chromobacterium vaccinii]MCD4502941.1 chemotaxis protein CheW [Chromobacterium piscinae]MCD5329749.1 chemotaxis protein CheW [Chromobacterium piscinae]NHQ82002.1 chemotaxis protein CheW [Chromobacterium vaccinii]